MKIKFVKWQTNQCSKTHVVVYYQFCVLIGWATTRLYVIAHFVAKSAGFENQNNDGWIAFS